MCTASRILFLMLLFFCGLNLAETLGRSAIPLSLQGEVQRLETRYEMEPGVDDVHLLWIGNRFLQIDPELAGKLRLGDRISKRPWERFLQTPRGRIPLTFSQDFRGMLAVMPWLLICGWVLIRNACSTSPTTKRDPVTTTRPSGPASSTAR